MSLLDQRVSLSLGDDASAEKLDFDKGEFEEFSKQIEEENFAVSDTYSTTKTRGSAQRAFSEAVRRNYSGKCAITGIQTRAFLVASHIVPWGVDPSIRLDPSNGICLSLLMDRAFEHGFITISDELVVQIDWKKVNGDTILGRYLKEYDGVKLSLPSHGLPKREYLGRRRAMVEAIDY